MIDAAAKGGFTTLYLNLEAGWINEADRLLRVNLDSVLPGLVRYGNSRKVGLLLSLEYAGMEDKPASDAVFRRIRLFEVSGDKARQEVSNLRKPLSLIGGRAYYLKAMRRALGWHPAAVAVSFDDFPATDFEDCRRAYGTGDVRYLGKTLGGIATDVQRMAGELSPATAVYILPRFYGPPHWKSHPQSLPDLLEASPQTVHIIVAGDPDEPYLKPLRTGHPGRFAFWLNLTSNHMKDGKIWFPTEELAGALPIDKLRGQPDSEIILNFGSPAEAQKISLVMSGAWLRSRKDYDAFSALAAAARDLGIRPADVEQYARLISWNTIRESLGWNVLEHLKTPEKLPDQIRKWRDAEAAARKAGDIARSVESATSGHQPGRWLALNADRIERDYAVAGLVGKVALDPSRTNRDALRRAVMSLGKFIQSYPVIPNDPKDAEVVSRGFRFFQQFSDNPEKFGGSGLRRVRAPADDR